MPRPRFSTTDLDALQRQLDSWRQTHSPYRRLPEEAWAAAALLAARLGVSRVAHALGLDYNKLKDPAPSPPALPTRAAGSTVPPGFVDVEWNNWIV